MLSGRKLSLPAIPFSLFPMPSTSSRKKDHIDLCLDEDVRHRAKRSGLERYELVHNALPEIDFAAAGIDPKLRPENLSPEDYARLSMNSIL